MAEDKQKVIEKYYIETSHSNKQKFIQGLIGGLGWAVGITLGSTVILAILGFFASRTDFVPIIGHFTAEVIKSAQQNLKVK